MRRGVFLASSSFCTDKPSSLFPSFPTVFSFDGNDLKEIGIKTGLYMGKIIAQLHDAIIDEPSLNIPETLLDMAKSFDTGVEDGDK